MYCTYATGLIEPPEEPEPPILGGYGETIFEDDFGFYADLLLSPEVLDQLREELGIDFPLIRLVAYREQIVAGINYVAKYEIADPEGDGLI